MLLLGLFFRQTTVTVELVEETSKQEVKHWMDDAGHIFPWGTNQFIRCLQPTNSAKPALAITARPLDIIPPFGRTSFQTTFKWKEEMLPVSLLHRWDSVRGFALCPRLSNGPKVVSEKLLLL